ncbi:MAG: helix-turn-helix domain-containing protein [Nitrososphaeraceae archaeon]|nr:helix-turn-helix domain-containing protein [Nitrososphaeraceae archaeon]
MNMNGLVALTDICKKYSVSRKTYYKWKNRYNNGIKPSRKL